MSVCSVSVDEALLSLSRLELILLCLLIPSFRMISSSVSDWLFPPFSVLSFLSFFAFSFPTDISTSPFLSSSLLLFLSPPLRMISFLLSSISSLFLFRIPNRLSPSFSPWRFIVADCDCVSSSTSSSSSSFSFLSPPPPLFVVMPSSSSYRVSAFPSSDSILPSRPGLDFSIT